MFSAVFRNALPLIGAPESRLLPVACSMNACTIGLRPLESVSLP
jgi:hypothetical protein